MIVSNCLRCDTQRWRQGMLSTDETGLSSASTIPDFRPDRAGLWFGQRRFLPFKHGHSCAFTAWVPFLPTPFSIGTQYRRHRPAAPSDADSFHRPDSLGAKLVQREPHESTGFGDGELLILLCELAALFDGFVEGLLLPSRVVF